MSGQLAKSPDHSMLLIASELIISEMIVAFVLNKLSFAVMSANIIMSRG